MNNWNGIGRLTRDPELKTIEGSETSFCRFSIAINGFKKDDTHFFNCVAWNKTAELIFQHFNKGSRIGFTGRLEQNKYLKADGTEVSTVQIVANSIDFIDTKSESQAQQSTNNSQSMNGVIQNVTPTSSIDDIDDDLPW